MSPLFPVVGKPVLIVFVAFIVFGLIFSVEEWLTARFPPAVKSISLSISITNIVMIQTNDHIVFQLTIPN